MQLLRADQQAAAAVGDAGLVRRFLRELGRGASEPTRVHVTRGASAVLLGWRRSTIDLDVTFRPDRGDLFAALPGLKERLAVNVELAAPPDFVPELPGWDDRSIFIAAEGRLQAFHHDFYSQALSKVERGHAQDQEDVRSMLTDGLVTPAELRRLFALVESALARHPAVDPPSPRRAPDEALAPFEGSGRSAPAGS